MKSITELIQLVNDTGCRCGEKLSTCRDQVYVHIYGNNEPPVIYTEDQFRNFTEYFL